MKSGLNGFAGKALFLAFVFFALSGGPAFADAEQQAARLVHEVRQRHHKLLGQKFAARPEKKKTAARQGKDEVLPVTAALARGPVFPASLPSAPPPSPPGPASPASPPPSPPPSSPGSASPAGPPPSLPEPASPVNPSAPPPSGPASPVNPSAPLPPLSGPAPKDLSERIANPAAPGEEPKFFPYSLFSLHKKGIESGPTLLVVGGIQGDEPGGFSAASLLATHYTITKGDVWIVPDLNFPSILERNRGLYGDMNRKFAALAEKDPEYAAIQEIKSILLAPEVDLVLNLHDGSGYYRATHIDAMHNPNRWGQCVIIDQSRMDASRFGNLEQLAERACADANKALLKASHSYRIRNTHTANGDKEMEKSLSFFAVKNGKPAFGVEASKDLATENRAYYHLQIVESFMRQMGIKYERKFELSPEGVLASLNSNLQLAVYKDRIVLPLEDVRPSLGMFPFRKGAGVEADSARPLLALVREPKGWRIAYGNRTLTRLSPEYMDFDDNLPSLEMLVDGKELTVRMGEVVTVDKSFLVRGVPGYRVNAIGAVKEKDGTESDVELVKGDFQDKFSVDKGATLYRVEVYKDKAFSGMVLVRFGQGARLEADPLTATRGPESDFGY